MIYDINFLPLALMEGPYISPIKKMTKPLIMWIAVLQIKLNENGWETKLVLSRMLTNEDIIADYRDLNDNVIAKWEGGIAYSSFSRS